MTESLFTIGLGLGFLTTLTLASSIGWREMAKYRLLADLLLLSGFVALVAMTGAASVTEIAVGAAMASEAIIWCNWIVWRIIQ